MSSGGELELQKQVDGVARERGWRVFALPMQQRVRTPAAVKGWPDRAYFRYGRILVLEFKAQKDTVITLEQEMWLEEWRMVANIAPNVHAAVVRPSDYDTIVGWLT